MAVSSIVAIVALIVAVILEVLLLMCLYTIVYLDRQLKLMYTVVKFYTGVNIREETEED